MHPQGAWAARPTRLTISTMRGGQATRSKWRTEVTSQSRSAVVTDGITGLRINHLLDVHIGDLNLGM